MKQKKFVKLVIPFVLLVFAFAVADYSTPPPIPGKPDKPNTSNLITNKITRIMDSSTIKAANKTIKPPSSTVQSNKHDSVLLKNNPNAGNIPYYPMQTVNDPSISSSWAMTKVQAKRAWDLSSSSSQVVVAVIDTGFALNHEELSEKWHINDAESGTTNVNDACWTGSPQDKRINNCDDDNNGYIDDWRGYDFFNNDNNPMAGEVNPSGEGTGHGSMVAGVIAAAANNSKGSAGVAYNAQIMPLQIFSDDSEGYTTDIVAAVEYAANNGANVINLSLGGNGYDSLLLSAIRYAQSKGVFVVAASGNCALNDQELCNSLSAPGRMTYPALYPEVFAVGATNSNDVRASFSSYGSQLDMVAPGSSIGPLPIYTQSNQTSAYATASGTSFSSPLVAGIAALLISQNPGITISQISYILTDSAEILPTMNGQTYTQEYGYGNANAHKATLLGLAKTQDELLGTREIFPREPAVGNIWRSVSGDIGDDEYVLVGCRVPTTDKCSTTAQNGSTIYKSYPKNSDKGDSLQYMFIGGSNLSAGTWTLAVQDHEYANAIATLYR